MAGSVSVRSKVSSVSKNTNKSRTSDRKARLSKSSITMKKESSYNRSRNSASATNNNRNRSNKENSKSISDEISRTSSNNNKSSRALAKNGENNNNAVALPIGCECGPDLYTPVLGPTVDETILNGLNTILQLYNKLRDCGKDKDNEIDDGMGEDDDDEDNLSRESIHDQEDESMTGDSAEVGIQEDLTPPKPSRDKRSSQTLSNESQSGKTQTKQFSTASFGVQVFPSMVSKVIDVHPSMVSESLQVSLVCPNLPSQEMPERSSIHQVLQTSAPVLKPAHTSTPRSSVMSLPMQTSRPTVNEGGFQTPTPSMTDQGVVLDTRASAPKSHQTPPRNLSQGSIQTESSVVSMSGNQSQTETAPRRLSQGRVQTDPPPRREPSSFTNQHSQSQSRFQSEPKPRREPSSFSHQQSQSWSRPPPIEEESAPPPQINRPVESHRTPSYTGSPSIYSQAQSQTSSHRRPSVTRHTSDHVMTRDSDSGDSGGNKGADQGSETSKERRDSSSQNQKEESTRQSGGDEHSCISPPEPPKSCPCCKCTSSSRRLSKKRSTSSSHHRPECVCRGSKTKLKCRCSSGLKKGDSSCSKLGKGDSNTKDRPIDVKYAITKISKYEDFTTYEVMKSTHSVPKKMPKGVDGVFVLKKRNGRS